MPGPCAGASGLPRHLPSGRAARELTPAAPAFRQHAPYFPSRRQIPGLHEIALAPEAACAAEGCLSAWRCWPGACPGLWLSCAGGVRAFLLGRSIARAFLLSRRACGLWREARAPGPCAGASGLPRHLPSGRAARELTPAAPAFRQHAPCFPPRRQIPGLHEIASHQRPHVRLGGVFRRGVAVQALVGQRL